MCPSAITCPRPENPHLLSNCTDSVNEWHIGSVCSLSCSTGFNLQGKPNVQCRGTGQWSSVIPTCVEVQCPRLDAPVASSMSCSGSSRGAVCTIICDEGFSLQGAARAVCTDSAEWYLDGEKPTCTGTHSH